MIWWCEKHKSQQFDEESCWLRHAVLPEGALVKAWWCLTHKIGDGDTFAHWQIVAASQVGESE